MKCVKCGGEINLTVGRCIICGAYVDEERDVRIVRDVSGLMQEYGLQQEEPDSEPVPRIFGETKLRRSKKEAESSRPYNINDAKKPTIELETYMELIGERRPSEPQAPADQAPPKAAQEEQPGDSEQSLRPCKYNNITGCGVVMTGRFANILARAYNNISSLASSRIEKLVKLYRERVPQLNRAKSNAKAEKLAVLAAICAAILLLIVLTVFISTRIPPPIRGEWLIGRTGGGDMLTVEFGGGGKVVARAYSGGEENIYRTGSYKTRKRNGYNMLIITYDDGEQSRLYYEITKNGANFTNVDSNESASYVRLK